MDNLAHSVFGAVAAEAGLKRLTPLATATLVIGANLPDVDAFAAIGGADAGLFWRRGVTHGVLALALWPFVLTALMLGVDRIRRRRHPDATPAHAGWLFALSALGVWSHTSLDWLNSYGVRWLMPFDGRWFYGDTLFIVDPWFWLIAATAVVLARTSTRIGLAGWIAVAMVTTALVVATPFVPATGRILWLAGVIGIGIARVAVRQASTVRRVAQVFLGVLVVYIALMWMGSWRARSLASGYLTQRGIGYNAVVANPIAADSLTREVIVVHDDRYSLLRVSLVDGAVANDGPDVARGDAATRVIDAALSAPEHRGLRNWLRLPAYEVDRDAAGWRVVVRDLRYSRLGRRGPGETTMHVP
jgi:inner membrane protein